MGNSLSFGLVRRISWISTKRDGDYGRPFVEMIKDHYMYGPWIDTKAIYELKLVHRLPNLHWYLLIKKGGSSDLPYITLEITTSGKKDLIPVTRDLKSCDDRASDVGTYDGTLLDLCKLADEVVKEMGTYNLMKRNCQHFCNNLLKKLYKDEFSYTFESNMTDDKFDYRTQVCPELVAVVNVFKVDKTTSDYAIALSSEFTKRGKWRATKIEERPKLALSRPVPPPTINDFTTLLNILVPIQNKWKDLGSKLSINPVKLDKIEHNHRQIAKQCLREMLREYLQRRYPPPKWEKLANQVNDYNHSVAIAIIKRAESIV